MAMITHPEKVMFPDDGITKGDLAAYYEALAPVILPHLRAAHHDGAVSERHRPERLLAERRLARDFRHGWSASKFQRRTGSFTTRS